MKRPPDRKLLLAALVLVAAASAAASRPATGLDVDPGRFVPILDRAAGEGAR